MARVNLGLQHNGCITWNLKLNNDYKCMKNLNP